MLRYDEILEDYRRSVYGLRKLLLLGTQQQRTQVGRWGWGSTGKFGPAPCM